MLSLGLLFLAILYLAGRPLATADLWWHLALGRVYLEQGLWLSSDPLTFSSAGPPVPHQWLFGVALHAIERSVGFDGLRVVHVLAVAAILALAFSVLRRESRSLPAACAATSVFAVAAWPRLLQLRPDLVSMGCVLLVYRLLIEPDRPPSARRILAAVAVAVVWVNCHPLFAVGLALLLAAWLGCLLRAACHAAFPDPAAPAGAAPERARARRLALALGVLFAATLLNPRGIHQHTAFFVSASSSALWEVRDEWTHFDPIGMAGLGPGMSPLTLVVLDAVLFAFGVTAVWGLVRLLRSRSAEALRAVDPVRFALGAAAILALGVAVRFAWMVFLPLLFLLRFEREVGSARSEPLRDALLSGVSLAIVLAFPLAGGFSRVAPRWATYLEAYDRQDFYADGVEFLRDAKLEGRLYNGYAIGGFLDYWLAPRIQTFVDGRMNFPPDVLRDYRAARVQRGALPREGFLELLDRWGFDLFFGTGIPGGRRDAESTLYTTTSLERASSWVLVSRSTRHAVYLRANERNRENLRRVVDYYAGEGIPFDPERGLDVRRIVEEHPSWAVAHGMLPPDHTQWPKDLASADPTRRARALDEMAENRWLLGLYLEQRELDRQAIELHPDHKGARRRQIAGLLRLDSPREAIRAARELLALDPDDRRSRRFLKLALLYGRRRAQAGPLPGEEALVALDTLVNALPRVDPLAAD